jgi:hypothetical protein
MRILCLPALIASTLGATPMLAEKLPQPAALESFSGAHPMTVTVVEPHESTPGHSVAAAYLAFPAPVALAAALGPDWATKARAIEFRALDGYVSYVSVARLTGGKAYLAFARADGRPFAVDNVAQNQNDVPLGPYYLIWDNRNDPDLIAKGDQDWPYQVADVSFAPDADAALRPAGIDPSLEAGLVSAKDNCLTCHKVNGYGGNKAAGDLAVVARGMSRSDLVRWALDPSAVDRRTTMPALTPNAPEPERRKVADSIYEYLSRVPVVDR